MAEPSDWHRIETYKSLITLSIEALKLVALINGGAAVALLTYLGTLKAGSPSPIRIGDIRWALMRFCFGIAATALAFVAAYCTQFALYVQERDKRPNEVFYRHHGTYQTLAVVLAVAAILAFGVGCWIAASALISPT